MANELRYGKGIYFSNEIEKCLQYYSGHVKCVFLCKIIMG